MNKLIKSNPTLEFCAGFLSQQKVLDLVLIDVRKISNLPYDCILIGTCQSEIQLSGILSKLKKNLKSMQVEPLRLEYTPGVKWGILDTGDFILHLFEKKTREYYSIEKLWDEARMVPLEIVEHKEDIRADEHEYL